jgi:hypothetical protein
MFESLAAQGRSMLRRLEAERAVAPSERESLPPHERVPIREALDWDERAKARIAESCDDDTQARLALIFEMRSHDFSVENDGYTPSITAYHRIVDLLDELDAAAST